MFYEWIGETEEGYKKRYERMESEGIELKERWEISKKETAAYFEAFKNEHGFEPLTTRERILSNGLVVVMTIITVLVIGGMILLRFLVPFFKYPG